MDHLDVQLAHRLICGQLDPEAHARWERHLRHCPRCRRLLAGERALMTVLGLGEDSATATSLDVDRLLDRVAILNPQTAARRRRGGVLAVGGLLTVIVLAILLGWQLASAPPGPAALAEQLRIPRGLQNQVLLNLSALTTLERDPWLADQYEAVRMLERLIAGRQR